MKKLILFFIVLFIFPMLSEAQRGKGKERLEERKRKEKQKEEFKYFNQVFGVDDNDFEVSKVEDKWKDEPVVILCQKVHISFLRETRSNTGGSKTKGIIRKRVKIQDKSSLDDFSEFYYQESDAFALNLIKPDGSKTELDLGKAVKVETEIPRFYSSSFQSSDYFKLAIPNLEVGDIIDYTKIFTEKYTSIIQLVTPISSSYPIQNQEIIFDVDKLWNFNYNSFNGAPKFKRVAEGGVDLNGRKRKSVKRFLLKDEMRDTEKKEIWVHELRNEPLIKIMARPPGYGSKKNKDIIETNIDLKESFKIFKDMSDASLTPYITYYTDRNMMNKLSKSEKVDHIYNAIRMSFMNQAAVVEIYREMGSAAAVAAVQELNSATAKILTSMDKYYEIKDEIFVYYFSQKLTKHKIEHDIVAVVPRSYGDVESVVVKDEINYGIYVPSTEKYYWRVDNYLGAGQMDYSFYKAKGYKIQSNELRSKNPTIKSVEIEESDYKENGYINDIKIKIEADNKTLSFDHQLKLTGAYKSVYHSLFLFQEEYLKEDQELLTTEKQKKEFEEQQAKMKKKAARRSKRNTSTPKVDVEGIKSELSEKKKERVENWLTDDFELEKLMKCEVNSYGRFEDDLKVNMVYSSSELIKKAGPNLIFDIGKLIGSQVALDDEDVKERTCEADVNFAKTIENNLVIILPEGFKAEGIDQLDMNVDNAYGAFISKIEVEGNILRLNTRKTYKKQTIPTTNWSDMVEVLEAAYEFTQKKVILKK